MKQSIRGARFIAAAMLALSVGVVPASGIREGARPPPIQRSVVYYDDAGTIVGVRRLNCVEADWGIVTDNQQNFPGCVE